MAGPAVAAESSTPRHSLTLFTALGCVLAAYVFLGAPGIGLAALSNILPVSDAAAGWFPAMHLLVTAAILSGAAWFSGVLRTLPQPGLLPLAVFAVFQFGLVAVALTNLAIAAGGIRMGGSAALTGILYALPAFAALRVHPDMYLSVLRFRSWSQSVMVSPLGPVSGGALVALTVAANLVPLTLTFQSLTTHSMAQLTALFRRAVVDPQLYLSAVAEQTVTLTAQETMLAGGALALSLSLGGLWTFGRFRNVRRASSAQRLASGLSEAQLAFIEDAIPAATAAIVSRASARRFVAWTGVWSFLVAPVVLGAGYLAYRWFSAWQENFALSWVRNPASDLTPFATGEAGIAHLAIPAAALAFVLLLSGPLARLLLRGARYDRLAFAEPLDEVLRSTLTSSVASGAYGPGQPFDADAFALRATRKTYWVSVPVALVIFGVAAGAAFRELARGVAFTGDGMIVQDHSFAQPKLVRYHEVRAISLDCRLGPLGGKPVYELTLPDGRIVDMIGEAPLSERLDQYIGVDQRLQFSGVGYAYPPGNMEPCLKAIQKQHNSVIAAGTARLLHVLD